MHVAPRHLELGTSEPALGELLTAVAQVDTAEDAELEHLLGRELGLEARIKAAPRGRGEHVAIALLHLVSHRHRLSSFHTLPIEIRDGELQDSREGDPRQIRDVGEGDPLQVRVHSDERPHERGEDEQDINRGERVVL